MTSTTYGGSDGFEDQSFRAAQHFKHGAVVLEKGEDSAGYWNRSTQRQLAVDGYLEPVMEFPAAPELLPHGA